MFYFQLNDKENKLLLHKSFYFKFRLLYLSLGIELSKKNLYGKKTDIVTADFWYY
jgi:hypothetical protein